MDISTWDRTIAVNLRGSFILTKALLPTFKAQKGEPIVNILSSSFKVAFASSASISVV
ncbi:MAG: SDR family NAD(P)-dependent oxidoreductase [Candidatus Bathyarchaeia archaeon]